MRGLTSLPRRRLIAGGVAVILIVAALAFLIVGPDGILAPTPQPTPTPSIRASASEIRAIPDVPDHVVESIADQLEGFLADVYERAFLPPVESEDDPPEATPVPRPALGDLFTGDARDALERQPEAFGPGVGEIVLQGTVSFEGGVSVEGESGTSALLEVTFSGRGRYVEPPEEGEDPDPDVMAQPLLRVEQTGEVLLIHVDGVWRVAGFDVSLTVERQIPQDPEEREAQARWMP